MFKSVLLLAAAATVSVQAQNLGSLASSINPSLSGACLQTLYTASNAVKGYCGISDATSLISNNASGDAASLLNAIYYISDNSTTLNTTCSEGCGSYLDDFAYSVLNNCGDTPLLKPTALNNVTVTGSDLANTIRYVRRGVCVPGSNNTTYCIQSQLASYRADFPNPANTTYQNVLADTNITCQACTRDQLTQLRNTTSLSTYWRTVADSYVNNVTQALNSSCPAPAPTKRDHGLYARSRLHRL